MWRNTPCSDPHHPPLNASRLLLVPSILLFTPTGELITIIVHIDDYTIPTVGIFRASLKSFEVAFRM